jgi:membrane associated rhomboid family serine protease
MPLSDRGYMQRGSSRGDGRGDFDWFTQNPVLVIIVINILFYLATSLVSGLAFNLGLVTALVWERPWTIITSLFVHQNFGHIFGNMITLYFFGRVLSQITGKNRFLLIYFTGGIVGNLLFVAMQLSSNAIVIGASGAVYAIAGALVMWFIAPMPLWVVVLIFFVLWSFIPGVAWQAHIGGLAVGLIAGFILRRSKRHYILR